MQRVSEFEVSMEMEFKQLDVRSAVMNTCVKINWVTFYPWNDMQQLVNSTFKSGEYWIATCKVHGCVPECQGLFEGVKVSHAGNVIEWKVRRPMNQEYDVDGEPFPEEGYDLYWFDRGEYITAISSAIDTGREMISGLKCPVKFVGRFRLNDFLEFKLPEIKV